MDILLLIPPPLLFIGMSLHLEVVQLLIQSNINFVQIDSLLILCQYLLLNLFQFPLLYIQFLLHQLLYVLHFFEQGKSFLRVVTQILKILLRLSSLHLQIRWLISCRILCLMLSNPLMPWNLTWGYRFLVLLKRLKNPFDLFISGFWFY